MPPSMREELVQVPNPYPVVAALANSHIWALCEQARELARGPGARD